jgi:hypothetical protein
MSVLRLAGGSPFQILPLAYWFLPTFRIALFRFLRFAHRDFAAFLAISLRRLADNFFIRAFADLRPIAEKYFDNLLSITRILYHAKRLSITGVDC